MSLRDSQFGDVRVPLAWIAAAALIVAAIVVGWIIYSQRDTEAGRPYGATQGVVDKVGAPIGNVFSAPIRWTDAGVKGVRGYFFAVSDNRRLRRENAELRAWRDEALKQREINERIGALLGVRTDPPVDMIGARAVTDARGPFSQSRLINAGADKGVKSGYPVISEYGVVGRVTGVADRASRVLLVTDIASRTPVMIERTNARSILTGDGSASPKLEYLRGREPVKQGDRIVTSGDGGLYPRGLPVGVAVKGVDGAWRVRLYSDNSPIDYVLVVKFDDFAQVDASKALNETRPPPPTAGAPPLVPPPSPKTANTSPATKAPDAKTPDVKAAPPAAKAPDPKVAAAPAAKSPETKAAAPPPAAKTPLPPAPKAAAPAPPPTPKVETKQ